MHLRERLDTTAQRLNTTSHVIIAILVVVVLSAAIRIGLTLSLGEQGRFQPDSVTYIEPAWNLLNQHAFLNASGHPEVNRTPGYPLYLSTSFALDLGLTGAIIGQHLLSLGIAIIAAMMLPRSTRYGPTLVFGLTACNFLLILYSSIILTEILFAFLSMVSFYLLLTGIKESNHAVRHVAGAAIFAGCATLVRPIGLLLFVPSVIFLIACAPKKKLLLATTYLCIFMLLPASWMMRNHAETGMARLSPLGDFVLIAYQAAGTLAMEMPGDWNENMEAVRVLLLERADKQLSKYTEKPSQSDRNAVYRQIAIEEIMNHPLAYAKTVSVITATTILGNGATSLSLVTGFPLSVTRALAILYTIPATILTFIGIVICWKRHRPLAILSILFICYFIGIPALTVAGDSRFRVPVEALYCLNMVIAIEAIHQFFTRLAPVRRI